jgi:hypothetical protein
MKKQSSGHPIGGGIGSKNVVNKPVITGKPAYGVGPGWASQLGSNIGNHATESGRNLPYRGEAMHNNLTPAGGNQPLGNAVAAATKCGVGGSRTIYASGSQGKPGPVRDPIATGRDTLSQFGPDSANARNRR